MKKALAVLIIVLMTAALSFAGGGSQPQTGDAVSITVQLFDRGTDGGRSRADDNAWTDWIKEKVLRDLNINVTFFPVGRWTEGTDIVNLMASGSAPDLCYSYQSDMIANFRDMGGILNLTPHLALLPDARRLLGDDPAFPGTDFIVRDREPDGRMFSIPSSRVALAQRNIFIRKDWLDALGLPVPTTTAQFEAALVAFRDRDPGNVGRNNVIPFAQDSDARWGLANLIHPFIQPNLSDRDRFVYAVAGRNIYFPGFVDGVRLMNRWYNEGLIFRDFPLIQVADDFYNMIKSGFVGAFSGNWDLPYRSDLAILADLRRNVPNADFVPVDAIQSSDGITHKDMFDKVGLRVFVPAFSRQPEAALRYLNWLCIPENYMFIQRGHEGVNHEMVDGIPQIITRPPNDPWIQNSAQNIDFTMLQNGVETGNQDNNIRALAFSYPGFSSDVILNAYNISVRNARAPVVVNVPTPPNAAMYGQTLQDMTNALLARAITASPADFDRVWTTGIQDWLRSGGQAVFDERVEIANQFFR